MYKKLQLLHSLSLEYLGSIKTSLDFYESHMSMSIKVDALLSTKELKGIEIDIDKGGVGKYAAYEAYMSKIKQVKFIFNTYDVDNYPKYSQLSDKLIKELKKKLTLVNTFYDECVKDITKEFDVDIEAMKFEALKALKSGHFDELKKYAISHNVFSVINKYLRPNLRHDQMDSFAILLEDIKDSILGAQDETRPSIITTLYNLSSREVNIGDLLGIKPFKLTKAYFKDAAKLIGFNIIVINLSKKVKFKYNLPKVAVTFVTKENVEANKCYELLNDDTIFDADEISYYDARPLGDPKYKTTKTIIIKTLGSVNYIMTKHYQVPDTYRKSCAILLNRRDRIHTYNKVFEDAFLENGVFETPHKKDLSVVYQRIQLNTFKHKIVQEVGNKRDPKEAVLAMITKQIKELFDADVYEYIKEFEALETKLENLLVKGSVEEALTVLFNPNRNIYKAVVDQLEAMV
jgi:hypothetical protein